MLKAAKVTEMFEIMNMTEVIKTQVPKIEKIVNINKVEKLSKLKGRDKLLFNGTWEIKQRTIDHKTYIDSYPNWVYENEESLEYIFDSNGLHAYMTFEDFCHNRWSSIKRVRERYLKD